jgi:hypothetical protein
MPQIAQLANGPKSLAAKAKVNCERLRAALAPSPNFGKTATQRPPGLQTHRERSGLQMHPTPTPPDPMKESHSL